VPGEHSLQSLLALEGTSQLNGANLAVAHAPAGLEIKTQVVDSGTAAEGGANALERVAGSKDVDFVVAPLFGTQVLAMLPTALDYKMPILAPTGTDPVTEQANPYMFRLYPSDAISKVGHIRYVVDDLKLKKAAILYNTTGYGQSGFKYMSEYLAKSGGEVVFSEGLDLSTKEISATLAKLQAAKPDVILVQMHSTSMAMVIKQIAGAGIKIPVIGNTTAAMPATFSLLQPSDLKGVCAESASWLETGKNAATTFAIVVMIAIVTLPETSLSSSLTAVRACSSRAKISRPCSRNTHPADVNRTPRAWRSSNSLPSSASSWLICVLIAG
jgi:branched-chain amino acid transport system substrate-binding protein